MKIVTIVGTRPQFIKAAPLSRLFATQAYQWRITELILHTGQHYDPCMSQIFFDQLGLPSPKYDLGIGSGPPGWQIGEMITRIEQVLLKERPDWVLLYGDTNSTLAGALAASKHRISIAHVEGGVRAFSKLPPEEMNRIVADRLSDLNFVPTQTAVANLEREGITEGVHLVGDVMQDAVAENFSLAEKQSEVLDKLGVVDAGYLLATVHRAENTDYPERFEQVLGGLRVLAEDNVIVWPVHPRTRKYIDADFLPSGLRVVEPVSYFDMLVLERHAAAILTDSGGVQKEARWFEVPSVTLLDETEWVETLEGGWNQIAGANIDRIVACTSIALSRPRMARGGVPRSGAVDKIASVILSADPNA